MCSTTNDLTAQTRLTSRDVKRIMGGVALAGLGLFVLGIALAVGMADDEIEPFRAGMTIGSVASVVGVLIGAIAWSHALLAKRLTQILDSACTCPSGANGVTHPLAAENVADINKVRY